MEATRMGVIHFNCNFVVNDLKLFFYFDCLHRMEYYSNKGVLNMLLPKNLVPKSCMLFSIWKLNSYAKYRLLYCFPPKSTYGCYKESFNFCVVQLSLSHIELYSIPLTLHKLPCIYFTEEFVYFMHNSVAIFNPLYVYYYIIRDRKFMFVNKISYHINHIIL